MAISRDRLTAGRVGLRTAARAPQKARSGSGWYAVLARSGLVAKGASYAIVGVLALKLALGDGGKATSRQGALQAIAHHAYGTVLIALLAAGLAAYAIWRFVQAVAEPREDSTAKTWAKRAGYIGRGLIYAGLTYSAVKILVDAGGNQSQNAKAHKTAAAILSWSGGTWIVGILGAAIVVAGLANLYRALSTSFEDNWRAGEMGATARKWAKRIGVAGHLARAVVFGLIGIFIVKAAVDYNPKDAIGFDGALQKLVHSSHGPYLLGVTAVGLICYAVYCLVDARYRDVSV